METDKHEVDAQGGGTAHLEAQTLQRHDSIASIDHRSFDDRVEEARGRNADKIDPSYWYSWRFLGSMFAVGTSFAGGIGGQWLAFCHYSASLLQRKCRSLRQADFPSRYCFDFASTHPNQR